MADLAYALSTSIVNHPDRIYINVKNGQLTVADPSSNLTVGVVRRHKLDDGTYAVPLSAAKKIIDVIREYPAERAPFLRNYANGICIAHHRFEVKRIPLASTGIAYGVFAVVFVMAVFAIDYSIRG